MVMDDAMSGKDEGHEGIDAGEADACLRAKLYGETATTRWWGLQRFFAQGKVVRVAADLNLIEVGLALSRDQTDLFRDWLAKGKVALVADQQARAWLATDAHLWTLVIKPWILVQERCAEEIRSGRGGGG